MAKKPIEPGDWLILRVPVTAVWEDDRVTIEHHNGQKVTLRASSDEVVEIVTGDRSGRSPRKP